MDAHRIFAPFRSRHWYDNTIAAIETATAELAATNRRLHADRPRAESTKLRQLPVRPRLNRT